MRTVVLLSLAFCAVALSQTTNELLREMVINGADDETIRMTAMKTHDYEAATERVEHPQEPETGPRTSCSISIKAPEKSFEMEDPVIMTVVSCEGTELYNAEEKLSELQPRNLKHGIRLFAVSGHNTRAYAVVRSVKSAGVLGTLELENTEFLNLPKLPGEEPYDAPMVTSFGRLVCTNCTFQNNSGGRAGAMIIGGTAKVDLINADFFHNQGEVGAVDVRENSSLQDEHSVFERNYGDIVGGVLVEDNAQMISNFAQFYNNEAKQRSTAMFVTGKATAVHTDSIFGGTPRSDDLVQYLTNAEANDEDVDAYELARASAVELDAGAVAVMNSCHFENQSAMYGTVVTSGSSILSLKGCHFRNNAAFTGAGVYVEGTRGSFARVLTSTFAENTGRYGGALVVQGNGTFAVAESNFERNRALKGGAVWGDYTSINSFANGTCDRAASGSRIDIQESTFTGNEAEISGGAFFIKCTDIYTNQSTFTENFAVKDGGAMYSEDVYDLYFQDCKFHKNMAGKRGGSLFVRNSNDIYSTNSVFTESHATKMGGAIASDSGHGIIVRDSIITQNSAANGGAIHSEKVDVIDAESSDLTRNEADWGGAFSVHNLNKLHLERVDLSHNKANKAGGAVRVSDGKAATIRDITVTAINSGSGSVSMSQMGTVSVSDIDFHNNKAESTCGALEVDSVANIQLTDLTFRTNVAKTEGGALCLSNAALAEIKDTVFEENVAGQGGGGILLQNSEDIRLYRVNLKNNNGAFQGGAIKGMGVALLYLNNTTVESNEAALRGGAIYADKSSVEIEKCKILNNYVGRPRHKTKKSRKLEPSPENTVLATDAGGIVYISNGISFKSMDSEYSFNEATGVGGALMIENMDSVDVQYDTFLNGTAGLSGLSVPYSPHALTGTVGGCIYGSSVRNFSVWDSIMQYCDAEHGGAFILEGSSRSEGGYNRFINNTARSGGAFLCKGDSTVNMEATNFSYNAAPEGATVSIDCRCDVDFTSSAFYRDEDLRGNGDFFHAIKGCGSVNHNGCEFYGEVEKNGMSSIQMVLAGLVVGVLLCFFVTAIAIRRRRSKAQKTKGDIETGTSAPLIPSRTAAGDTSTEDTSSYESETEEGSEESEEEIQPKRRLAGHPVASTEEEESDDSEASVESIPRGRKPKTTHVMPFVPEAIPAPLGVRTAKQTRAVARHRKASVDVINDGAGPSSAIPIEILPPELPPRMSLTLSFDSSNEPFIPERKPEEP